MTRSAAVWRSNEQIGRLKVENDWLKKNPNNYPSSERRQLVDADFEAISVRRQCELLRVSRSSIYYEPAIVIVPALTDDSLMNLLDAQYTSTPF